MAFDGIFLSAVINEIKDKIINARVDKIYQPQASVLVFSMRGAGGNVKLLMSANASDARVCITGSNYENPDKPPMFCMLMRKHLANARLLEIKQEGFERIIEFVFEAKNELFDTVKRKLKIEIMGRYSNIILCDENDLIIDCLSHIDFNISSQRQVLPGLQYSLPPQQEKKDILLCSRENFRDLFCDVTADNKEMRVDKFLLGSFMGFSPIISREITYRALKTNEKRMFEINDDDKDKLIFYLMSLQSVIKSNNYTPCIAKDIQNNKHIDFSYTNIEQYGASALITHSSSLCDLLDEYYSKKSREDNIRQKGNDLFRMLVNLLERTQKKLNLQQKELDDCDRKEIYKLYAELITSNIYRLEKGMNKAEIENYYDGNKIITVPLDVSKNPSANAAFYYKKYHKAKTAEEYLAREIEKGKSELCYLESIFDALARATSITELNEIRIEMCESGYIRHKRQYAKLQKSKPYEFMSPDGFRVIVGRNNIQNEQVTFKLSRSDDIWMHAQKIPGSHTLIKTEGKRDIPETTLEFAAALAAVNSKAKDNNAANVDYTFIKNVKKIPGAKPGMVTYTNYKTIYARIPGEPPVPNR